MLPGERATLNSNRIPDGTFWTANKLKTLLHRLPRNSLHRASSAILANYGGNLMTKVKEIDIVYNLTRPSSEFARQLAVREVVEYLRSRGNYLDDELADLISVEGNSRLHFALQKRDGRRELSEAQVDRDVKAFHFIKELSGEQATRSLIDRIRGQISDSGRTIRLERNAFVVRKNGLKEFSIPANRPVSERCAASIASLLPGGSSAETIRTMVAKTKKDMDPQ
jgi:hypothetical protein